MVQRGSRVLSLCPERDPGRQDFPHREPDGEGEHRVCVFCLLRLLLRSHARPRLLTAYDLFGGSRCSYSVIYLRSQLCRTFAVSNSSDLTLLLRERRSANLVELNKNSDNSGHSSPNWEKKGKRERERRKGRDR